MINQPNGHSYQEMSLQQNIYCLFLYVLIGVSKSSALVDTSWSARTARKTTMTTKTTTTTTTTTLITTTTSSWRLYSTSQSQYNGKTIDSSDYEDSSLLNERNLRFSGVGRLYTESSSSSPSGLEHLDVIDRLQASNVVVVGLGGVGSWAAEALCRSGVGNLTLIDLDDICISNSNRQIHTLTSSVGKMKIDVMKERLLQINPECKITLIHDFVSSDNVDDILKSVGPVTACLDAIDGSKEKTALIAGCCRHGIPIVTCGGSAGRTDPTKFVCNDLTRVTGDPLLNSCRSNLRKFYGFEEGKKFRDVNGDQNKLPRKWKIHAVYSTEPQKSIPEGSDSSSLRRCDGALGTACFVTGAAGFVAAGRVVEMIATNKLRPPKSFRPPSINKDMGVGGRKD